MSKVRTIDTHAHVLTEETAALLVEPALPLAFAAEDPVDCLGRDGDALDTGRAGMRRAAKMKKVPGRNCLREKRLMPAPQYNSNMNQDSNVRIRCQQLSMGQTLAGKMASREEA